MRAVTFTLVGGVAAAVLLAGCDTNDAQQSEDNARQNGYEQLVADQPAQTMEYSPTRETVNYWVDTWSPPGKLSFVYLQNSDGDVIGYYVLEGLPTSYCAQLTPTYTWERPRSGYDLEQVPAPALDGAYYTGGGSCDTYYGKDATTGAYIEYTAGLGINVLLFDEPMERFDAEPLGPTTEEEAVAD